jgi:hypothetical protein
MMSDRIHGLRCFIVLCLGLAFLPELSAMDFAFRFMPEVTIPMGPDSELYSVGGGGTLTADFDLFGFFSPYLEAGVRVSPLNNVGNSLVLTNGGTGVSFFYYPIPRVKLRFGAGGGFYMGSYDDLTVSDYYYKVRMEGGYRFSPGFTLAAGVDYTRYLYPGNSLYSGISVGLTVDLNLGLFGSRSSGINVEGTPGDPVFPVFYSAYDRKPVGTVRIFNGEQAEIRDVKVFFQAGAFTSKPMECGSFPVIPMGRSVEVPLLAAFNELVLTLTENTKVESEILVTYNLLDSPREMRKAETLRFNHRNALTWDDERKAAVFISPNDPAVLEFSKFVAGLIRDRLRTEIDRNLQFGMGLFEGLRLTGLAFTPDPSTPYLEYRVNSSGVDYIQYPYQTLAYKGGDRDDLAVLYAAVLESVGVRAALIPLRDDFLVAFALGLSEGETRAAFTDHESFIFAAGKAWVPVRISLIREGFLRSWQEGIRKWKESAAGGKVPSFFPLSEAWTVYPPVGVPEIGTRVPKPSDEQVNIAFENAIGRFISRELGPRVERLLSEMKSGGTGRQHNTLGVLYGRYGLFKEARGEFEKAAAKEYAPAFTNLGNIAYLMKDYEEAVRYFERALKSHPSNKAALIGLARAKYELDAYAEADDLYSRVRDLDPAMADRYAYLSSRTAGTSSRASSAADRGVATAWEQE